MNQTAGSQRGARLFHPAARKKTVLGVWAHPDDEAYLSAAFMAQAVRAGHRVIVATATRGESGTDDPERFPPDLLGTIREAELAASLEALGVAEHRWLGSIGDERLTDGQLHRVSRSNGRALVARVIDEVRPDLIVTFGPDGLTGHSDHRAISQWVTDAWEAQGCPADLWYAAITQGFLDRWGTMCDELGVWMSPDAPAPVADSDVVHVQPCDTDLATRKLEALRAHWSQTSGLIQRVGEQTFARWWSYEFFAAAVDVLGQNVRDLQVLLSDPAVPPAARLLMLQGQRGRGLESALAAGLFTRLGPAQCAVTGGAALALAQPWLYFVLAVTAAFGVTSAHHPVEWLQTAWARRRGHPALPANRAARRFACALGAAFFAVAGSALMTGSAMVFWLFAISMVVIPGFVMVTNVCLPSMAFTVLFGVDRAAAPTLGARGLRCSLPGGTSARPAA